MTFPTELETGNRLVDEQHAFLLERVESLAHEMAYDMEYALAQLFDYFSQHFMAEEKLMEQVGFPELDAHQRAHLSFFDRFVQLRAIWRRTKTQAANDALVDALIGWLHSHVLSDDVRLATHIRRMVKP